jgi:hypothetical protein
LNDDDNDGCYGDFVVVFVVEESWLWWLKVVRVEESGG